MTYVCILSPTFHILKICQTWLLGFAVLGSFPVAKFSSLHPSFVPETFCASFREKSQDPFCFGKAAGLAAHLLLSSYMRDKAWDLVVIIFYCSNVYIFKQTQSVT